MCGIAGFYQNKFDYTKDKKWLHILEEMKESLLHRGPSDNGICLTSHTGFAHTRLSIIDLANGSQPMKKHHDGRNCMIVYNGELYNTSELKSKLSNYSLYWETSSDTEVILNGYLALGTEFFKEMNGIFAFGIYDEGTDELLLCRDRLGVKPLFYQQYENTFIFGSEQKAIFKYGIRPELDKKSWGEILGLGPARTPGEGVFKNMKEVLPGHFIKLVGTHLEDTAYWTLKAHEHKDSYEETVEKVSFLVYDSIKRQMVSDIPICTFLSGGLDSSLVSAICAKELKKEGKILNTFSFDFVGNKQNFKASKFQPSLDRPYVDIMVSHLNSNHTYLECDNQTQVDYLYKAVDASDLPNMADVESSLLYFCSKVSASNQVTLTGECADEIFGGYPWFHQEEALKRNHFPWSYDMDARTSLLKKEFVLETDLYHYAQSAYDNTIKETPKYEGDTVLESRRKEISYLNIRWFMSTLLNRMDRTSMYSGLEARVPFADHRILEYVYNIPWKMKCHNQITKSLLQETGKNFLPDSILHRKKSPYPKTYDPMYENLLKNRVLEVLSDKSSPIHGILDKKKVQLFFDTPSDYGKPWYGQLMAGPQMLAYILQINYWMLKYKL